MILGLNLLKLNLQDPFTDPIQAFNRELTRADEELTLRLNDSRTCLLSGINHACSTYETSVQGANRAWKTTVVSAMVSYRDSTVLVDHHRRVLNEFTSTSPSHIVDC